MAHRQRLIHCFAHIIFELFPATNKFSISVHFIYHDFFPEFFVLFRNHAKFSSYLAIAVFWETEGTYFVAVS